MRVMDAINARFGRDTLRYGATGLTQPWRMRQAHRSPRAAGKIGKIGKIGDRAARVAQGGRRVLPCA